MTFDDFPEHTSNHWAPTSELDMRNAFFPSSASIHALLRRVGFISEKSVATTLAELGGIITLL